MAEHAAITNILNGGVKNKVQPMAGYHDSSSPCDAEILGIERKLVDFNISGQPFTVSHSLLKKYPDSKLFSLKELEPYWVEEKKAYFFDRDPHLFNAVLNLFKYNYVLIPKDYNEVMFHKELEFWCLSIPEAATEMDPDEQKLEEEFVWMENRLPPPPDSASSFTKNRYKVWYFLTDPVGPYTSQKKLALAYAFICMCLTILFMVIFGLSTKPMYRVLNEDEVKKMEALNASLDDSPPPSCDIKIECFTKSRAVDWIDAMISLFMAYFIIDTLLRMIICPKIGVYFKSVVNWLDVLATISIIVAIPFRIEGVVPKGHNWSLVSVLLQGFQVVRIFRIFHYATLLDGLMVMMLTIKGSYKELVVLLTYLLMAMFFFSTVITFAELMNETGQGIPDVPVGYWWAVVTMTTVGYGDYYPESTCGYIIGFLCAITGVILTALPVAVIGSNFNLYWEHNKKRKQRASVLSKRQQAIIESGPKYN